MPMYIFHGARGFVHDQDTVNIHGVPLSRMHTGLVICTLHLLDHPKPLTQGACAVYSSAHRKQPRILCMHMAHASVCVIKIRCISMVYLHLTCVYSEYAKLNVLQAHCTTMGHYY